MGTTTRTTPLVNATVRIDPAHLIDSSNDTAVVVALGDGGTAWVRFPDGTENAFPIDALTVLDNQATHTTMPCPLAGTCTVEKCVNENDPVAQADCKLC